MTRSRVFTGIVASIVLLYTFWMAPFNGSGETIKPHVTWISTPLPLNQKNVNQGVPTPASAPEQAYYEGRTQQPGRHKDVESINTAVVRFPTPAPVPTGHDPSHLETPIQSVSKKHNIIMKRENMVARVDGPDPPPPWIDDLDRTRPSYIPPKADLLGVRVCGLKVCMMHKPDATRLFIRLPNDGCGSRLLKIVRAMAVAVKGNMNFGGATGFQRRYPNGIDFHRLLDEFFGGIGASEVLREEIPYKYNKWNKTFHFIPQAYSYTQLVNKFVFITGKPLEGAGWSEMTPKFLAALREPFAKREVAFAPGRPSVAMHLRRGDLPHWDRRVTADVFYNDIADMIRQYLPTADIHIFSNTLKDHIPRKATWERIVMYNTSEFDGFARRGMTVHLDDADLLVPWTHFIRATVFVSSDSSFSAVPSLINPNCVITLGHGVLVEPSRCINGRDLHKRHDQLHRCLAHIGLKSRRAP